MDRPKHALRSMAETRATSRAFRGPLEQIFVLAGFQPAAAEEMPADEPTRPVTKPETPPKEKRSKIPPEQQPTHAQVVILNETFKRLRELAPDTDWPAVAREAADVPSWDDATATIAEQAIAALRGHPAEPAPNTDTTDRTTSDDETKWIRAHAASGEGAEP